MKLVHSVFMFLATMMLIVPVSAQDGHIKLEGSALKQVTTTNEKGERELSFIEANVVLPGDIILYTTTFENVSNESATNIVINNRVPNNSWYRDGSASGVNTELRFSVDGENFDKAENLFVTEDGQRRAATAKDYVTLRWVYTAELKPAEKRSVSFKTQIKKPNE